MKGERQRWEERTVRVRRGLIEGIVDNETAKAAIREAEAALHALPRPDGACVQAGESLTGIPELWSLMTGKKRRDLVRLVLVKVEIDPRTGSLGGLIPKPPFAPLFRSWQKRKAGRSLFAAGDPERARGRQKSTTPRWGGLLLAKVASPLSLVRFRPLVTKRISVPDSQLPLFDLS